MIFVGTHMGSKESSGSGSAGERIIRKGITPSIFLTLFSEKNINSDKGNGFRLSVSKWQAETQEKTAVVPLAAYPLSSSVGWSRVSLA